MSFRKATDPRPAQFDIIRQSFYQTGDNPFADVLPEQDIARAFRDADAEFGCEPDAIYTPAVTLWAFLLQQLYTKVQASCVAAVERVVTLCAASNRRVPGPSTGAYCKARAKLQPEVLQQITRQVAERAEEAAPQDWRWHGRNVVLADGATSSMPDTPANQAEWPQPTSQKPGLGFPIVRMVVLFSLATGMLCNMALGKYAGKETGEMALMRQLLGSLVKDAILLADRYYCTYFLAAELSAGGRDFVTRLHHRRSEIDEDQRDLFQKAELKNVQRMGQGDHLVTWERPQRPAWMSVEEYEQTPESICVRYVKVTVQQRGFRSQSFTVTTSLTDAKIYPPHEIAALYHRRWVVELDIRSIKTTMGLDVLRCKSPHMIQNELWVSLLAYNLVRAKQAEAAVRHGKTPRTLSFAAALQSVSGAWQTPFPLTPEQQRELDLIRQEHLSTREVGHRPGRVEPRAVKRRPKPHKYLNKPRREAKAELMHAT